MLLDDTMTFPPQPEILADKCKGCTACIKKCPADAIVGARKMPHRIVAEKCTGCGECAIVCKFDAVIGFEFAGQAEAASIEYQIGKQCKGCTICAQHCPVSAIPFRAYRLHRIEPSVCIQCDVCRTRCPQSAITVKRS